MKSQTEMILDHLKSGRTLTKAQCWETYHIMNTGGRINELRVRGHDIHTRMVQGENGSEHAIYFIPRAKNVQVPVLNGQQYEIPV